MLFAAVALAVGACGSKPKPVIEEPEETGPLTAAEALAKKIREGGELWWAKDGVCRGWEIAVEIDDDEGVLGLARRTETAGAESRTYTYKISVNPSGEISAIGPSMTSVDQLGKTSAGATANCTNRFGKATAINGGVRLVSLAGDGESEVLDERWFYSSEACQAAPRAAAKSGCGR